MHGVPEQFAPKCKMSAGVALLVRVWSAGVPIVTIGSNFKGAMAKASGFFAVGTVARSSPSRLRRLALPLWITHRLRGRGVERYPDYVQDAGGLQVTLHAHQLKLPQKRGNIGGRSGRALQQRIEVQRPCAHLCRRPAYITVFQE